MSKLNSVMGFLTNHPRAQNKLDYIVRKKDMHVIVENKTIEIIKPNSR